MRHFIQHTEHLGKFKNAYLHPFHKVFGFLVILKMIAHRLHITLKTRSGAQRKVELQIYWTITNKICGVSWETVTRHQECNILNLVLVDIKLPIWLITDLFLASKNEIRYKQRVILGCWDYINCIYQTQRTMR